MWAKKWLRWTLIIIVLAVLCFLVFGGSKPAVYETATVSRGTVTETVTATGQIKPKSYASLHFKTAGTIASMNGEVGDVVRSGQILATLDVSDLSKKVTQAQADLIASQVALENSQQDIADASIKSNQSLTLLYDDAAPTFADVLNLSQQAYATISSFYDLNNRMTISVANTILSSQLVINANNGKETADGAMIVLRKLLENFPRSASREKVDATFAASAQPLADMQTALTALINAVAAISSNAMPAATLDQYKTALATASTNLNSAITKQTSAASKFRDTGISNSLASNSAEAQERTAAANVEKTKAALAIAQQNLTDVYLRAPFAGTIATKSKQIGELVTSADQVYYVLGQGGLEVVANIPEVDIARIHVGADAEGTLDAFSASEQFPLTIESIDPDQTTIDGVVYYKTHFIFKNVDARFRSGMSVNLTMTANQKTDVLVVPRRAVSQRAASSTIRVLPAGHNATPEVRNVSVGLRGDSDVEIISGLVEGDLVIVGEKK